MRWTSMAPLTPGPEQTWLCLPLLLFSRSSIFKRELEVRDVVQLRLGPCLVLSGLAYMPIQLNSFRWKNIYLTIFVITSQAASIYSRLRLLLCDVLACFVGTSTVRLRGMGRDGRETYILQFPRPRALCLFSRKMELCQVFLYLFLSIWHLHFLWLQLYSSSVYGRIWGRTIWRLPWERILVYLGWSTMVMGLFRWYFIWVLAPNFLPS